MKKLLCLLLVLVMSISVFIGCGKNDVPENTPVEQQEIQEETPENLPEEAPEEAPAEKPAEKPGAPEKKPASSSNKKDPAPISDEIYYVADGDISYHKKDCKELSGKEPMQMSIEMIETIGFNPCENCKPSK